MPFQSKIYTPVAIPPKFLGAPRLLAFCNLMGWFFFVFIALIDKNTALWSVLFILCSIPTHLACIYIGTKEPHIDSLIKTYHLTKVAARTIGKRRSKKFYAG